MDQDDRKHVARVLKLAVHAMHNLLEEGRFAVANDALAEMVNNFGRQLAAAFEAKREIELVERWNKRAPDFRQNLFIASRGRYERAMAEGRVAIISEQDVRAAEEAEAATGRRWNSAESKSRACRTRRAFRLRIRALPGLPRQPASGPRPESPFSLLRVLRASFAGP